MRRSLIICGLGILQVLSGPTAPACQANEATGLPAMPSSIKIVTSPSHPDTLLVRFNQKLDQDLRWDRTSGLTACVTYSLIDGGGDSEWDPSDYRTFVLHFPMVRRVQNGDLIVLNSENSEILLGHLEKGIYGSKVTLNDNVRLMAHREKDRLVGKLVVVEKSVLPERTWIELDRTVSRPPYSH